MTVPSKHPTPLLDELEGEPWPSFVTGLKHLAERNSMMADLGQLERSYEARKGYWKGGTVGCEEGSSASAGRASSS